MQKERFTNGQMNKACEADECNKHAPSRTDEPVKSSSMQARNNMLKFHQANQGPSKTPCTSPCEGETMIHHEYIHHLTTLYLDMDSNSSTNVPALSCQVISSHVMSHVTHISTMGLLSINVI